MQAIEFILETLGHFVKRSEGPPPGISAHAGPEFERELMWLCEWHALTPIVLASLEQLALRPQVSRITLERMKALAKASRVLGEDLLATTRVLSKSFAERKIEALFVNDVALPHSLYPSVQLRPVERIEVLLKEGDWSAVIDCCSSNGFRFSDRQPRFRDGREALRYYQYFAPCCLENDKGDQLYLRLRLLDLGATDEAEATWQRQRAVGDGLSEVRSIGLEDQLIQSCLTYNMMCFDKLLHAVDIGLILTRFGSQLEWPYVAKRLRSALVYPAGCFTLGNVIRWLRLDGVATELEPPGILRKKIFALLWHADYDTFATRRPGRFHRIRFCMLEVGSWREKLNFWWRIIAPKSEWVAAFFGTPSRPWLKLKFVILTLKGRVGVRGA
ncbi:MAG: nucleotidyltransferase family protein [Candidatus Krumholzibacteria bacterium]|nr:nucleotidyltransferase family protein [Candidatus Krumholzibacteria bacterium]